MFSVMAGVNYSLEEMSGHSTSKTTSSETETSGTVQDLDAKYLSEEYGIPEAVTRSYGFTWTLGKDEVDLGLAGRNALVVGYNVSNIGAPARRWATLRRPLTARRAPPSPGAIPQLPDAPLSTAITSTRRRRTGPTVS